MHPVHDGKCVLVLVLMRVFFVNASGNERFNGWSKLEHVVGMDRGMSHSLSHSPWGA